MWQIYLLKSWLVSFYVTIEGCHIRKITRVDDSSHKMSQIWDNIGGPQFPTGHSARDQNGGKDDWRFVQSRNRVVTYASSCCVFVVEKIIETR